MITANNTPRSFATYCIGLAQIYPGLREMCVASALELVVQSTQESTQYIMYCLDKLQHDAAAVDLRESVPVKPLYDQEGGIIRGGLHHHRSEGHCSLKSKRIAQSHFSVVCSLCFSLL